MIVFLQVAMIELAVAMLQCCLLRLAGIEVARYIYSGGVGTVQYLAD